jgi:hypothetical protein
MRLRRTMLRALNGTIKEKDKAHWRTVIERHEESSGPIWATRESTEKAKEFADDSVRKNGQVCSESCKDWEVI